MSKPKISNSGNLFVVSAPSGAGKTTVVRRLLKRDRKLRRTVSHTTRSPRPGERNGREYFFVSKTAFRRLIRQRGFVEWAKVYGNYYGTSKSTIRNCLSKGHDVVLIIEQKGARAIRRQFKNAVFILVLPPRLNDLKQRMTKRRGTPASELVKRLRAARREISSMRWYTHTVINDRIPKAVASLAKIIQSEREIKNRIR